WPWEIALNVVGTRNYRFALDVTVPGQAAYRVDDRFKVPRTAENLGLFDSGNKIPVGLELPVRVDPRERGSVWINWEGFKASAGRKDALRAGVEASQHDAMRRELERKPKLLAKTRANNRSAAMAWAEAVRIGNISREEFERQVTLEVETGRMDPADAEAARRAVDA
ncbi:MAG: hypothetical protein ACXWYS_08315, partial [Gaiellaceae bacterium]